MTLRPATLSNRWPHVLLGEAVEFLDHLRRPITASERTPGPYPYYGANGRQDSVADYLFDEPLVLLAEDGGHFDDPSRGVAYGVTGKCWVNNHAHVLRPRPGFDFGFLRWHLAHYDLSEFVNGATRAKLTKSAAERIPLIKPPPSEQRRIADILDKADAIRRKRKEAVALTEELLRSAFLEIFGDPVTNPRGWETVAIEDLASEHRNALALGPFGSNLLASDYTTSGHPVVFVRDLVTGRFAWKSNVFVSSTKFAELSAHHAESENVLATKMGDPPGIACVLPRSFPRAVITADVIKVSVDSKKVHPEYLAAAINSPWGRQQVARITAGVTRAKITLRDFRSILVRLPPPHEQLRFVEFAARLESIRGKLSSSLQTVEELLASLSQTTFQSAQTSA